MFEIFTVFLAGIITLTTPCVLPLLPVYLATMLGGTAVSLSVSSNRQRLLYMSVAFSLGFMAVFTLLGLGASLLGALLNQNREILAITRFSNSIDCPTRPNAIPTRRQEL